MSNKKEVRKDLKRAVKHLSKAQARMEDAECIAAQGDDDRFYDAIVAAGYLVTDLRTLIENL